MNAAAMEEAHIGLCGRIQVHAAVHGRCHKDRCRRGQNGCGQHVIGNAGSHLGKNIGRGGGNDEKVCPFGHRHMLNRPALRPVKGVRHRWIAGEGFKCQRTYKFAGILGHDDLDLCPALLKETQ